MIRDYYYTLPPEAFENREVFKEIYTHPRSSIEDGKGSQDQQWQGMVKELKRHTEKINSEIQTS